MLNDLLQACYNISQYVTKYLILTVNGQVHITNTIIHQSQRSLFVLFLEEHMYKDALQLCLHVYMIYVCAKGYILNE